MNNGLAMADYIILAGFFVVMMIIGVFYAGRMKSLKDFFSGGRQVPWWISGLSLYMTTFSAFTFVSYSALAYKNGFVCVTIWWLSVPACLVSAHFLAPRWRRAATTSPLEYIETRFGPALRQGFSWTGVPLIVIDDALKLFVIGTMVTVSLGVQGDYALHGSILVCGGIILAYTFLGGLWAVMITDVIQFIIVAAGVIVLVPLALTRVGGVNGFLDGLPRGHWALVAGDYTWPWLIAFGAVLLLTYAAKWPYVQRYYAVASDREARKTGYLVAALMFIGPPLLFLPAMAARVFLPEVADANSVYPMLCRELLPAGMLGVIIAAMFSATMSMLSSDYNAAASVITNDVIKRLFSQNMPERSLVWAGRLSTFGIGVAALAIALMLASADTLDDLVQYMAQLFGVLLPPMAIPMVAGLVTRKTSNGGALSGFVAGTACGVAAYALGGHAEYAYLRSVPYISWITILSTLAVLIVTSKVVPDSAARREETGRFLDGLEGAAMTPKAALDEGGDATLAIRIVGGATAALGVIIALAVLTTAGASAGKLSLAVGLCMAIGGGAIAAAAPKLLGRGGAGEETE